MPSGLCNSEKFARHEVNIYAQRKFDRQNRNPADVSCAEQELREYFMEMPNSERTAFLRSGCAPPIPKSHSPPSPPSMLSFGFLVTGSLSILDESIHGVTWTTVTPPIFRPICHSLSWGIAEIRHKVYIPTTGRKS